MNKFLCQYFDGIIDYNFTANVEKEFDSIAEGKRKWNEMISEFYAPFHKTIEETTEMQVNSVAKNCLALIPIPARIFS